MVQFNGPNYFFGLGVPFGAGLVGVSQQGAFSILPLALHQYVPSFCFTHIVSLASVPNVIEINAKKAASLAADFILSRIADASGPRIGSVAIPARFLVKE